MSGSVTDKNCSELSQPEMSITQIKFKIQWSFRTSFLNYSHDNFSKTTKDGHIMHEQGSCSHAKIRTYQRHLNHIFSKMIL